MFVRMTYCCLCLMLLQSHFTQAFTITNRSIIFYSDVRSTSTDIVNDYDSDRSYVVRVASWELSSDVVPEIYAFPPVFTLGPGEKQTVRLLIKNAQQLVGDNYFRLTIEENNAKSVTETDISTRMAYAFPVFYTDRLFKKPEGIIVEKVGEEFYLSNTTSQLLVTLSIKDRWLKEIPFYQTVRPNYRIKIALTENMFPIRVKTSDGNSVVITEWQ